MIMRINDLNGEIICTKNVNIHDDIIKHIKYDCLNSKLTLLVMADNDEKNEYTIVFTNVVGLELTSCDYWGRSPHVLDFEYVSYEKRTLLPRLLNAERDYPLSLHCKLITNKKYIETIVTFTSGDKMIIACEYIDFNKAIE